MKESDPFVTSSFLLLVVRPGATSSVLAPLVAMPFVTISQKVFSESQEDSDDLFVAGLT